MTGRRPVVAREATPDDNEALVELSLACPMQGDIGLCVDRAPDFFALNRLEGEQWRVAVVDGPDGRPVGCISVAERRVHVNGEPTRAMYVSDLKVHPDHRGVGVADVLSEWAQQACFDAGGPDVLTFLAILAGNRAMERRMNGPRGLPHIERVATIRTHTISLLWQRRFPRRTGLHLAVAEPDDLEEMAELWDRVAPLRHFSEVYDGSALGDWIDGAPGLGLSDYLLARQPDGRLAGFLGIWDQLSFKRLRVTSYSRRLGLVRLTFNGLARITHGTGLPGPGGALASLNAVHACVPPDEPAVLRSLVVEAHNTHRGRGYSFLNLGLDVDDPLSDGLSGLLAQTTDIWFCIASRQAGAGRRIVDSRPVHHEIALV